MNKGTDKYIIIKYYHDGGDYPIACFDSFEEARAHRHSLGLDSRTGPVFHCPYLPAPSVWKRLWRYLCRR